MNCDSPIRIKNQYNGDWLYVSCNRCDSCKISKANSNVPLLHNYINTFKYHYFITLTYDNNYVPFVRLNDYYHVYRLIDGCIDVFDEPLYVCETDDDKLPRLKNHPFEDAVGVVYYRDIQLFYKRFRKYLFKNYGKQKNFKVFTCCEYGSRGKRPHFHFLLLSNNISFEQVKDSVLENWSMCDWDRLDFNEVFKMANDAVSSYLSSYVNCVVSNNGFYSDKRIKAKTSRSKDVSFCIDDKVREAVKKYVCGRNNIASGRDFQKLCGFVQRDRLNISSIDLSARILFSYFRKFKGLCKLAPGLQYRRGYEILCRFVGRQSKKVDVFKVSSLDYNFTLCYRRFCELFNLNLSAYGTIRFYLDVYFEFISSYCSWQYRKFVLRYVKRDFFDIDNYLLDCYNSYLYDLDVRDLRFGIKSKNKNYVIRTRYYSTSERARLSDLKVKYKRKLIGKHVNDIYLNNYYA